jgi:L-iditol 2-dehydrogenase
MKAALWYNNSDIRIQEVPRPQPGPDEMLVKIISCGICGSDIVEWYRLPRAPLVQGHEIGGQIVETGKNVRDFKPGDRVFIAPKVPCLACDYCKRGHFPVCTNITDRLPGGFSEFVLVPKALVNRGTYRLPQTLSYDQSTFIEPLACVIRAQDLAHVMDGQTVMIIGCGMSGLLHVKLAKTKQSQIIAVDINEDRLTLAQDNGAHILVDATGDMSEALTQFPKRPDVVILCTSAPSAIDLAWRSVDKGGTIVFFAVPDPQTDVIVPINDFWMKEITILTSYYCGPPDIMAWHPSSS